MIRIWRSRYRTCTLGKSISSISKMETHSRFYTMRLTSTIPPPWASPLSRGDLYASRQRVCSDSFHPRQYLRILWWGRNSLRKAFLKAPLDFFRITSRFTNARFHPILKRYRAHHGVDYAAPTGTPVRSIGAGTVIAKGYQNGGAISWKWNITPYTPRLICT